MLAEADQAVVIEIGNRLVTGKQVADFLAERLEVALLLVDADHLVDLLAHAGASPAQVSLEDLADIHARRHAQRVQHDVDRRTVFEVRHVFDGHDARNHALVAVTAGHLVARLDLALGGDEDLDHLHHARRKFVTALQLVDLVDETLLEQTAALFVLSVESFHLGHDLVVFDRELPPLRTGLGLEHLVIELGADDIALRASRRGLAEQHFLETRIDVAVEDRLLVVTVLGETLDFLALDGHGALVLVDAVAIEHAHFNDSTSIARRHAQGGVTNVRGLLAEDGAEELFFRRHRLFALGRDLADEDVARRRLRHRYGRYRLRRGSSALLPKRSECRG